MIKIKCCKHDTLSVFTNNNFAEYTFIQISKNDNLCFFNYIKY